VVVASHGYIEPDVYETIDYTTRYADALARSGYLVLHPNLRGYSPSDEGDNLFRVGMAVDVLNLIAIVRSQGGRPGPLAAADPQAIGVWGHSMGGGVSTRVITVDQGVRAAVLYGPMSGDERQNYERILNYFSDGQRGLEELNAPPSAFRRISPIYYLDRIQTAVSLHHGGNDSEVPLAWSQDLCRRLDELAKTVECFTYPGQPHTFYGDSDLLFMQRMVNFYDRWLKSP
jgi:dipeptidyl aminopeptidase/acylaminoacyl peptidase